MHFWKKLIAVAMAGAIAGSAVACGSSDDSKKSDDSKAESEASRGVDPKGDFTIGLDDVHGCGCRLHYSPGAGFLFILH